MRSRENLFIALSITMGLCIGSAIIFGIWQLRPNPEPNIQLNGLLKAQWPEQKREKFEVGYKGVGRAIFPYHYFIDTEGIGMYPRPNQVARVLQYAPDGSLNYEVDYTFDSQSRRLTVQSEDDSRPPFFLFGCSFAFGEGLRDEQTLSSRLAALKPEFQYYNFAVSAWGPANILKLVSSPKFGSDIPKNQRGKALYVFIDHHIVRTVGGRGLFPSGHQWADGIPNYELGHDGIPVQRGFIGSTQIASIQFFKALSLVGITQLLEAVVPLSYSDGELKKVTAVVKEIQRQLTLKFDVDFYVVIYPDMKPPRRLLEQFVDANFKVLDYSKFNIGKYLNGTPITPDGHPSSEAIEFLARQIFSDLELNGEID